MSVNKVGVLVMSYGTPESFEQIEAYYTHIRHGHPPSNEQLADLTKRYEAIVGGVFPLRENTNKQVQELEETLNRLSTEVQFICFQGWKHATPFIEDGVEQIVKAGISEAVGIVLAPHFSTMSVGDYIGRAKKTAETLGLHMRFVESYHLYPKLLDTLANRVNQSLQNFPSHHRDNVKVIFSAHSLPVKILEIGDPYPKQLLETAEAVAKKCGLKHWQFAWQSAGRTDSPWLGPDILEVLRGIHEKENRNDVLMCPIGFVSDHLEVLYDIDIECKGLAAELGMHLERTTSLNTDPLFMETLAENILLIREGQ